MRVEIPSVPTKNTSVTLIRNWPITLFSIGLFPILVSLGFWQLERAEYKETIREEIDARLSLQPARPDANLVLRRFTPVSLSGQYTGEYFLLDNRTRSGRAGYEVLQVFISADQRWLINRGWIPLSMNRDVLPKVFYPKNPIKIIGFLYPVAKKTLNNLSAQEKNRRIQLLDKNLMKKLDLYDASWVIRLSADSNSALVTDWNFIKNSAERHRAYSVQWFCMAIALVILWVFAATNFGRLFGYK
ncbi:SURF1 family protein [Microbulbifer sp. NBRC 101763]|uniref:SURF1 family protein n=1 Tax=Microbulbifer sp. NBRC 101763 TaxID=1113820 RepID=UPI00333ED36E